jgi:hypothetical protein
LGCRQDGKLISQERESVLLEFVNASGDPHDCHDRCLTEESLENAMALTPHFRQTSWQPKSAPAPLKSLGCDECDSIDAEFVIQSVVDFQVRDWNDDRPFVRDVEE